MSGKPWNDADVLVVGAGPVGLLLAGELRLGGASVLVVDRLPSPTTESRASTVHARTMELLALRGLSGRFGTPENLPKGHFGGLPLNLGRVRSRYAGQWKIPQTAIERVLAEWATGAGARLWRGHELTGLRDDGERVEARISGPGGPLRVRAKALVGCDGENGVVGSLAGFEFTGPAAEREIFRADLTGITVPDRRFERHERGLAIASTRDGITRVMVHEYGRKPGGRTDPGFPAVAAAWRGVTGEDIEDGEPLWVNAFGDARRQATRYRRGRVLLAGDAAHQQMPVGGQALNLGLQDAMNLGWKLAAWVRDRAPERVLDTYDRERRPVGARTLANIGAQAMVLLGGSEVDPMRAVLAELLELPGTVPLLAGAISGLDVRYPVGGGDHPLLGRPVPVVDVEPIRSGRAVLLSAPGTARADVFRATAASWADRVALAEARIDGVDEAVLIRPDGRVIWADEGPVELEQALSHWFGPAGTNHTERNHRGVR
ncbi:FAD-dependent monooxygenase [Amycolatopsis lurida]|uniref:FAD-dependent monooxygenase n=1 Tax=Amycolatopsis lurida TaxID=31959 RepID=UPI0036481C58